MTAMQTIPHTIVGSSSRPMPQCEWALGYWNTCPFRTADRSQAALHMQACGIVREAIHRSASCPSRMTLKASYAAVGAGPPAMPR